MRLVYAMKFAARCTALAIRCMMEILAGPLVINAKTVCKGKIALALILGRPVAGHITATVTLSTRNVQVQGPAAHVEEAMENLEALDKIYNHLLSIGCEGVPAAPRGLEAIVDSLPDEPTTSYVEQEPEAEGQTTGEPEAVWKPLATIPSEVEYKLAVNEIARQGLEALSPWPSWRTKFAKSMIEGFGAELEAWEQVDERPWPTGAMTDETEAHMGESGTAAASSTASLRERYDKLRAWDRVRTGR